MRISTSWQRYTQTPNIYQNFCIFSKIFLCLFGRDIGVVYFVANIRKQAVYRSK